MTSRRNFIKTLTIGGLSTSLIPACKLMSSERNKITILHTNDVHSHIEPFPANHAKFPNMGGFARRTALIKRIREEEENVLLLDCGDIFQGTPYFNFYKGELDISLMGKMKYDAATIGNHEFDNGATELAKQIKKADFPFINTNYDLSNSVLEGLTHNYRVIKRGNIKVGIIGAGIQLEGLVDPRNYDSIKYHDPVEICNIQASHLKNNLKCDLVICLSHLGYQYNSEQVSDISLAKNSGYIDLILGGHTHTFLEKPTFVQNKANKTVVVNQAGWGGIKLGRIDMIIGSDEKQLAYHSLI